MFSYIKQLFKINPPETYGYIDEDGWYVSKPNGWKVGIKLSPSYNTVRVDMKSLREHVFGKEDDDDVETTSTNVPE